MKVIMFILGLVFLVLAYLQGQSPATLPAVATPSAEQCDSLYQEMWEQRDHMHARDALIHEAYTIGCPMEDI